MTTPASIRRLVIATRESALAMWQAEHVRDTIRRIHPAVEVVIDGMTTQGDQILDRSLSKVGGKGLFVKEHEAALLAGRADLAVHSLKDVPMTLAPGMALGAIMVREDPSDAFVSGRYASPDELPDGAIVGTSSLRREAQFRAAWPHVQIRPVRGNVNTRLAKLDHGEFDAILLASAGLLRLGFADRIRMRLEPARCIPSPGQGALAIEVDRGRPDVIACLAPLHDRATALAVFAERSVSRALGGDCTVPLGAHATWSQPGRLHLAAVLGRPDGTLLLQASDEATIPDTADAADGLTIAEALGRRVGERLLADGGTALLAAL